MAARTTSVARPIQTASMLPSAGHLACSGLCIQPSIESPGGSYVSLLRYGQFPVQSAKFPVSILREFGGNALNLFANAGLHRPHRPQAAKFPCIFPQNREYRAGDGFADDCLHRQF